MGYTILFVEKGDIEPLFGKTILYPDGHILIKIRNDLPCIIDKQVYKHESYHARDLEQNGKPKCKIRFELRANWYCFKNDPIGWFLTALITISNLQRIKYYFHEFIL